MTECNVIYMHCRSGMYWTRSKFTRLTECRLFPRVETARVQFARPPELEYGAIYYRHLKLLPHMFTFRIVSPI